MAIIKNATPFDAVMRKFSSTDEIYFKNRKADNATIGVRMKHPNSGNSASQIAHRAALTATAAKVKAILAAQSTDTDPSNYNKLQQYKAAFPNQKRYMYLYNYIFAQEYTAPTA